jgi:hypothetical protein
MKLFIPWRLFFNAYSRQPATQRQSWLEHFKYDDSGVFLIRDVSIPESKNPRKKFLSELERVVLSAIVEPKRPKVWQ